MSTVLKGERDSTVSPAKRNVTGVSSSHGSSVHTRELSFTNLNLRLRRRMVDTLYPTHSMDWRDMEIQ